MESVLITAVETACVLGLRTEECLDALRALADGRCTVAGFHVPAVDEAWQVFAKRLKPLLTPGRHKLIGCMRRQQGLEERPTFSAISATERAASRWMRSRIFASMASSSAAMFCCPKSRL
mgnify:CR=1 FL=1